MEWLTDRTNICGRPGPGIISGRPMSVRPPVLVSSLPLLQLIKRLLNRRAGHSGAIKGAFAVWPTRLDPECVAPHRAPAWTDGHVCLSPVMAMTLLQLLLLMRMTGWEEAGWKLTLAD